jgi:hypothetical protein
MPSVLIRIRRLIIAETDPAQAEFIPTSMLKNVDNSLYRAMSMYIDGTLPFGEMQKPWALLRVVLAWQRMSILTRLTPADVKAAIEQVEQDLLEGKISLLIRSSIKVITESNVTSREVSTPCWFSAWRFDMPPIIELKEIYKIYPNGVMANRRC